MSQPPVISLKERIAALQQRNNNTGAPPPVSTIPASISAVSSTVAAPTRSSGAGGGGGGPPSVFDKIAKFEKKGGVPVPKGSFGMGAPPPAENMPARKRGELYGNRIPNLAGGSSTSRPTSPLFFGDDEDAPPLPFLSLALNPSTSTSTHDDRDGTGADEASQELPADQSASLKRVADHVTGSRGGVDFATAMNLAKQVESKVGVLYKKKDVSTDEQDQSAAAGEVDDNVAPAAITLSNEQQEGAADPEEAPAVVVSQEISTSVPEEALAPISPAPAIAVSPPQPFSVDVNVKKTPTLPQALTRVPRGPALLTMEDDPTTPTTASPSRSPAVTYPEKSDESGQDLTIPDRPMSMLASPMSPGQVFEATRISPQTAVPMVISPSVVASPPPITESLKVETAPVVMTATTTTAAVKQNAVSKPAYEEPDFANTRAKPTGFSAVVHRKVKEPKPTTTTTAPAPETPVATPPPKPSPAPVPRSAIRVRRIVTTTIVETPSSPGLGDLAALLEEAAVLELALEQGQLPSEKPAPAPAPAPSPKQATPSPPSPLPTIEEPALPEETSAATEAKPRSQLRAALTLNRGWSTHKKNSASVAESPLSPTESVQARAQSAFLPDYRPPSAVTDEALLESSLFSKSNILNEESADLDLSLGGNLKEEEASIRSPSSFSRQMSLGSASYTSHASHASHASHLNDDMPPPPTPPPKSPSANKYFSGLRRLSSIKGGSDRSSIHSTSGNPRASTSSMFYQGQAVPPAAAPANGNPRYSVSTWSELSSSEGSSNVIATPLTAQHTGTSAVSGKSSTSVFSNGQKQTLSEFGTSSNGHASMTSLTASNAGGNGSVRWPSLSSKKSGSSISKGTSIVDKLWPRSRTKSNGKNGNDDKRRY